MADMIEFRQGGRRRIDRVLDPAFLNLAKPQNEVKAFGDVSCELFWQTVVAGNEPQEDDHFFVVNGRLRAIQRQGDRTEVLNEIARGETIGELALVTGEPRSATVLAVRDSLVARMTRTRRDRSRSCSATDNGAGRCGCWRRGRWWSAEGRLVPRSRGQGAAALLGRDAVDRPDGGLRVRALE